MKCEDMKQIDMGESYNFDCQTNYELRKITIKPVYTSGHINLVPGLVQRYTPGLVLGGSDHSFIITIIMCTHSIVSLHCVGARKRK